MKRSAAKRLSTRVQGIFTENDMDFVAMTCLTSEVDAIDDLDDFSLVVIRKSDVKSFWCDEDGVEVVVGCPKDGVRSYRPIEPAFEFSLRMAPNT